MNRSYLSLCLLGLFGCSKPSRVNLPTQQTFECEPYGIQTVTIDYYKGDPQYKIPALPNDIVAIAHKEVVANWPEIWSSAKPKISKLLQDYKYGQSLDELIISPNNSLNVFITLPEEDERYRLDVFIDVGFENGSHVFGVEFSELTPLSATATF